MKNLKTILFCISICQASTALAQQNLRDTLTRCVQKYQSHVDYFIAANYRADPQMIERFQKLFLHPNVRIEHNIPNDSTDATPSNYIKLLSGMSLQTKLVFQRVLYCRNPKNERLFYIHVKQIYNGEYVRGEMQQRLPMMYLTWTFKDTLGSFLIASIKKTPPQYAIDVIPDDDGDKIPNFCDKCPQIAGALEDSGADPAENCTGIPKCFTYIVQPPQWEDFTEQIRVKPPRYKAVAATYETITERVMNKTEAKRWEPVPATFEAITETYTVIPERRVGAVLENRTEVKMVRPSYKIKASIPTTFETVTETVLVKPETKLYDKDRNRCDRCPCSNSVIPAQYQKIIKFVIKIPASIRETEVPAEYTTVTIQVVTKEGTGQTLPAQHATITRQVLKSLPNFREILIPAEYTTLNRQVEKTPATCKTVDDDPNDFVTVRKKRLVQGARYQKKAIPCGTSVFQVQTVEMPAVYEQVKVYDAQNKVIEVKQVETVPAYKTFEVSK